MIVFGLVVGAVVAAVLGATGAAVGLEAGDQHFNKGDQAIDCALFPAQALSPLLIIIGLCWCMHSSDAGLRSLAASCAVFVALGLLLKIVPLLASAQAHPMTPGIVLGLNILGLLLGVLANCTFVGFLGRIGLCLDKVWLQKSARVYIVLFCVWVIGELALGIGLLRIAFTSANLAYRDEGLALMGLFLGLGLLAGIVVFGIWELVLIVGTFSALAKSTRR